MMNLAVRQLGAPAFLLAMVTLGCSTTKDGSAQQDNNLESARAHPPGLISEARCGANAITVSEGCPDASACPPPPPTTICESTIFSGLHGGEHETLPVLLLKWAARDGSDERSEYLVVLGSTQNGRLRLLSSTVIHDSAFREAVVLDADVTSESGTRRMRLSPGFQAENHSELKRFAFDVTLPSEDQ